MASLRLEGVSLSYPDSATGEEILALEAIDLSVGSGEFVVALGPSGCGKTTLLNLMAGFLAPSAGSISLDGTPVTGPGRERAVVFQSDALLPWLSVLGNAAFGPMLQGIPKAEREDRALEYLARVGLADVAGEPVYHLSGGMRQRLGLARALAAGPEILLMDEPLGALDAFTREAMQELVLTVWAEEKPSVFFITHDVEEALFLATRLVVMSARPGRLVHSFAPAFSRAYLEGQSVRELKASPAFIALREEILAIVRASARHGLNGQNGERP